MHDYDGTIMLVPFSYEGDGGALGLLLHLAFRFQMPY